MTRYVLPAFAVVLFLSPSPAADKDDAKKDQEERVKGKGAGIPAQEDRTREVLGRLASSLPLFAHEAPGGASFSLDGPGADVQTAELGGLATT